jgi:hypothetical protein
MPPAKKKKVAPKKVPREVGGRMVREVRSNDENEHVASFARFLHALLHILDWPEDRIHSQTMPVDLGTIIEQVRALKTRAESLQMAFDLLSKEKQ